MGSTNAVRKLRQAAQFTQFDSKRHDLHNFIANGTDKKKEISAKIDSKPHE
jgi:hypothetical protein